MVHGMLASGDTYAKHGMRFEQNGYCFNRIFAFDWNTMAMNPSNTLAQLDSFIDSVLAVTKAYRVDLIGHSAGAGTVYAYCNDTLRFRKVNKLVYIGAGKQTQPAGPHGEIPTLNIYSGSDRVVKGDDIPGAVNVKLTDEDHYEVATGKASFIAIYEFLRGRMPVYTELNESEERQIVLYGKAVGMGDNSPVAGGTVEIYEIDELTGERIRDTAEAAFYIQPNGSWGPFLSIRGVQYEFVVKAVSNNDRPIHYFREKAFRPNRFIYLRTMPAAFPMSIVFAALPKNDNPVLGVFTSSKAVIKNRDMFSVDGNMISQLDYFTEMRTTIATFLYDSNKNGSTDLADAGMFNAQKMFLAGIDMHFTSTTEPILLDLNGRKLNVRRIPSSLGVTVPVFD